MQALIRKLNGNYSVVYAILIISLLYIFFLESCVHEGIFFAGDQALKSLEVKQIAEGYGFKYLHLNQPDWVCSLWRAGYSPLIPPFFYHTLNGYIIVYPPLFQIVSAWFYSKMGSPGLYLLPLLCTFVLLGWTAWLLKASGITPLAIALGIFLLVFCSPLILYGTMFWEHLPAVMLLFAGVSLMIRPPSNIVGAVALGFISGLAIWLRPEAIVMNFLYCAAAGVLFFRERRPVYPAFIAAVGTIVLCWMAFNRIEYGSVLGVHGNQLLYDRNPDTRMTFYKGYQNLIHINYLSGRSFSFLALLAPIAWRLIRTWKKEPENNLRPLLLTAIVVLFSVITPFTLPNDGVVQWGPRYFLAIIPVTVVLLMMVVNQWNLLRCWTMPWWITVYLVVGGWNSFYHNTHGAYKEMSWRYNTRVRPIYQKLEQTAGNVVIVSHPAMMYDLAWLFDKNYFFLETGDDSLRRLLPQLKDHGVRQFTYIFDPRQPSLPPMLKDSSTRHYWVDMKKEVKLKHEMVSKVYALN